MRLDWASLLEILRQSHRVVLTSHIRPDCDALGSELGMAGILEARPAGLWTERDRVQ